MAWLSGWNYRKKITVQHANIDSDLTWFPLYVDITADGDIGTNISDSTNGYDIRFTKTDGTTLLKYEREYFNVSASVATGHFWVSGDGWVLANDAGTDLYIYYNDGDGSVDGEDAANVWDANFVGVWHLKESGDGSANEYIDSSGTGSHGQGGGSDSNLTPAQVTGKIYNGQHFDGSNDYIKISDNASLSALNLGTWEAWIKLDVLPSASTYQYIASKDSNSSPNREWHFRINTDDKVTFIALTDGLSTSVSADTALTSTADYYHVATTYTQSGNAVVHYQDGAPDGGGACSRIIADGSYEMRIGRYPNPAYPFDGIIDEARVSKVVRTVDWIKFTHANINEADNELDWFAEESEAVAFIPQVIMIN